MKFLGKNNGYLSYSCQWKLKLSFIFPDFYSFLDLSCDDLDYHSKKVTKSFVIPFGMIIFSTIRNLKPG